MPRPRKKKNREAKDDQEPDPGIDFKFTKMPRGSRNGKAMAMAMPPMKVDTPSK